MGKASGYICGTIFEIGYDPGGANPYGNYNRNSISVTAVDDEDLSDGGDSGGPWIGQFGNQHHSAFGIQSASFTPSGGVHKAMFTPIDPIYWAGFEILVNCPNYYC